MELKREIYAPYSIKEVPDNVKDLFFKREDGQEDDIKHREISWQAVPADIVNVMETTRRIRA